MSNNVFRARGLTKRYVVPGRTVEVFKDLDFDAALGQITVVLGRSGCGKTTLLRVAGGLEPADEGEISGLGDLKTAFVFQDPLLMPWLSVRKNVTFGLKKKEINPEEIAKLIELVGLTGFENAYPAQLSGGMKQRCALARALAYRPGYLFLDEPFAALDHFTRTAMQQELLRIRRASGIGMLFVTHSIDEALTIADRILIMSEGKICADYSLDALPHPRDLLAPEVIGLKRSILESLGSGTAAE